MSGLCVCVCVWVDGGFLQAGGDCLTAQQVNLGLFSVVERVLRKDQHLLQDKRLSRGYPLTVTPYCHKVSSSLTPLIILPA